MCICFSIAAATENLASQTLKVFCDSPDDYFTIINVNVHMDSNMTEKLKHNM